MPFPRGLSRLAILLVLSRAGVLVAQEDITPVTPPPDGAATDAPPQGDAYRPLGPELFPFYQHYLRTADNTTIRNILYLYTSHESPDGSWATLLAPLFYRGHTTAPESNTFYLFPLLYFHKESEEESFNYLFPLLFDRRTPETSFQFLVPFWLHNAEEGISQHHVLPPLFRFTSDQSVPSEPVTASRFGIPWILELLETRSDPVTSEVTFLNFFNWKTEARSGLPLYRYSWTHEGESWQGHTHLFPLYWHRIRGNWSERWVFPLFGYHEGGGQSDIFLVPLLSRFGGGGEDRRLDILFPLYHQASTPNSFSLFSFPLFGYFEDGSESLWTLLFWPYWSSHSAATGKRTHSFFFPLSHFNVEPDGSEGTRWVVPYVETFNKNRLWRFVVPLYYEFQALASGSTERFVRVGFPLYWSWGRTEDYFSMGFPLYWASRSGQRGWRLFLPFFLDSYSASSRGTHVIPFVSYRTFPSRRQLFLGGPLFIHETFYDHERRPSGTGNHLLWPLAAVENRKDGYLYRLLPLFWASRDGDTSDLLLTPFYYQQDGPHGTHRYFMPFYGHYESDTLERDYYGGAAVIRTREKDARGRTHRRRTDVLWPLASFEKDEKTSSTHQHILPLGYWRQRTPPEDHSLAFPFYYSHRVTDGDEVHRLKLILGNVFFSKTVEASVPDLPTPPAEPDLAAAPPEPASSGAPAEEGGAAAPEGNPALFPLQTPAPTIASRRQISRDKGILWPLTRSYETLGEEKGKWVFPFYFNVEGTLAHNFALFPFYFRQDEDTTYNMSFFRYFFLFDRETWRGGYRWTLGQILFDWRADENVEARRLKLLYPLFDYSWNRTGHRLQITPLFSLAQEGGKTANWFFPFFWQGGTEKKTASGVKQFESSHFFLLPFFGYDRRSTRTDYYALFPLIHVQAAKDAFRFEVWPSIIYRDEPSLFAARLWPLHAEEHRLRAGEFWVSRYLFLSKHFETAEQ
ncbi:MAG TPA: hypothetical protein VMT52_08700, partial [Planctomycetota bacterium]|nr:hypothetical protein [Planctomycetota bacterium]